MNKCRWQHPSFLLPIKDSIIGSNSMWVWASKKSGLTVKHSTTWITSERTFLSAQVSLSRRLSLLHPVANLAKASSKLTKPLATSQNVRVNSTSLQVIMHSLRMIQNQQLHPTTNKANSRIQATTTLDLGIATSASSLKNWSCLPSASMTQTEWGTSHLLATLCQMWRYSTSTWQTLLLWHIWSWKRCNLPNRSSLEPQQTFKMQIFRTEVSRLWCQIYWSWMLRNTGTWICADTFNCARSHSTSAIASFVTPVWSCATTTTLTCAKTTAAGFVTSATEFARALGVSTRILLPRSKLTTYPWVDLCNRFRLSRAIVSWIRWSTTIFRRTSGWLCSATLGSWASTLLLDIV